MAESIHGRIARGDYQNSDPYPTKPARPPLYGKRAYELADAEVETLAEVMAAYKAAMAEYEDAVRAWNSCDAALQERFIADLHAHYGMTGHPKADALYNRAYDLGHAYGLSEIALHYEDLVDLVRFPDTITQFLRDASYLIVSESAAVHAPLEHQAVRASWLRAIADAGMTETEARKASSALWQRIPE